MTEFRISVRVTARHNRTNVSTVVELDEDMLIELAINQFPDIPAIVDNVGGSEWEFEII